MPGGREDRRTTSVADAEAQSPQSLSEGDRCPGSARPSIYDRKSSMAKQPIFYDPERKRWRRLRIALHVLGIAITMVIAVFLYTLARGGALPGTALPEQQRIYRPIVDKTRPRRREPPSQDQDRALLGGAEHAMKASAGPFTSTGTQPAILR